MQRLRVLKCGEVAETLNNEKVSCAPPVSLSLTDTRASKKTYFHRFLRAFGAKTATQSCCVDAHYSHEVYGTGGLELGPQ
jgi:hypothetical protein